jgi:hypothetical protein
MVQDVDRVKGANEMVVEYADDMTSNVNLKLTSVKTVQN